MFMNFWYVAAQADELGNDPLKVTMLGHEFALFRDESGAPRCVANTCSHRGGSLAEGKVRNGCIECPYHGWQFNADGSCVRIPSMGPDAKIPARSRVDSYPVEERYGLIFVFLGDLPEAERPPIMDVPEWDDPNWRGITLTMEWDIDYKRSIENTMDPAHNEFTHPTHGFSGVKDDYHVQDFDLLQEEWGIGFMNKMLAPPLKQKEMREASGREEKEAWIDAGVGCHGPHCTWTYIHPADETWMHGFAFHTPIHETRDKITLLFMRNFLLDERYDQSFKDRSMVIAEQDRVVLEPMNPQLTPDNQVHEVFVPADKCIARYREMVKEWEDRGWRLDVDQLRADRGKRATAIPSPARREAKGWVLPEAPLRPGTDNPDMKAAAE